MWNLNRLGKSTQHLLELVDYIRTARGFILLFS
nr:hypothetical protein [Legionella gresilensis]